MKALLLENRSAVRIGGKDAESFLQGMISNDIHKTTKSEAIYAALLTAQGKFLFEFFVLRAGGGFLFDVEAARKDELIKKLAFYKLRADVEIEDLSGKYRVWAFSQNPEMETSGIVAYPDPRTSEIGWRGFVPAGAGLKETGAHEEYEDHRLALGLPDGSRDIEVDKRFILEANFKELNGVDFTKGCYIGQEMTARMTYRGSLKKRLLPVRVSGPLPGPGAKILSGGKEAGYFRSGLGDKAIALLRLEFLDNDLSTEGGGRVSVIRPGWLKRADGT